MKLPRIGGFMHSVTQMKPFTPQDVNEIKGHIVSFFVNLNPITISHSIDSSFQNSIYNVGVKGTYPPVLEISPIFNKAFLKMVTSA